LGPTSALTRARSICPHGRSDPEPRRGIAFALLATASHKRRRRFLVSYLPFGYGRGSALAIRGITLELRRELL
jgi:hypothetical protein